MKLLFTKPQRPTHMKMGIYGEAGSGKTFTASLVAIGIVEELRKAKHPAAEKPVYIFDTEKGSDWLAPLFDKHKIEYAVMKSRSFVDLVDAAKEAEKEASVLVVDSISHVWKELMQAYLNKLGKERIPLQYWGHIKEQWREFTDIFINSDLHMIVCGRAQDKWEYVINEDTGKKELTPVDTRMGGEKQMSYEPDTLIEMNNVLEYNKKGEQVRVHRAEIQKDRSNTMDGQSIPDPNFESFRPIWNILDIGGKVGKIDTDANSQSLVNDRDRNVMERKRRRKVAAEEVQDALTEYIPGMSAKDKTAKVKILKEVFGTSSWTAITEDWQAVRLEDLEDGVDKVRELAKAHVGLEEKEKEKAEAEKKKAAAKKGGKK